MFVSPAPTSEGLEERHRVESAMLMMSSARVEGQNQHKLLTTGIFPNKALLTITTYDPEDPGASLYDPGVKLLVDEAGKVTTKLGK